MLLPLALAAAALQPTHAAVTSTSGEASHCTASQSAHLGLVSVSRKYPYATQPPMSLALVEQPHNVSPPQHFR